MNDRPKTMAERTARPAGGDKVRQRIRVVDGKISGPDPAVELVGTSLSTALANAQANAQADAQPAEGAAGHAAGTSADAGEDGAPMSADASAAEGADAATTGVPTAGAAAAESRRGGAHGGDRWSESKPSGWASKPQDGGAKPSGSAPKPQGDASKPTSAAKPTSATTKAKHAFAATRSVARKLALQAIYRWLLNEAPWQDLVKEFGEAEDMPNADPKYFRDLVEGITAVRTSLDEKLTELVDRPVAQLDPVEHAVLLIGLYELSAKREVPYRVAINEAVGLAKRFGATDGHKFVNAVLDRAARTLRPGEN